MSGGGRGASAGLDPVEQVVEAGLAAAGGPGAVVIVEESSGAEVRYANNTTTTNGVRRDRRVTVIAVRAVAGGLAVGVARQGGAVDVAELAAAAAADAEASPAAEDAAPLLTPSDLAVAGRRAADPEFAAPAPETDLSVLSGVLGGLGGAFDRARSADRVLAGFAEHELATTYLGTSTGLRLRHVQPTGALHLVARAADGARSAWTGTGTADFADVRIEDLEAELVRRLAWAERSVELPAGRYETLLPPAAVADLMAGLVEAASGRESEEGRTVFSGPDGGTRRGQAVSTLPFHLYSDPAHPVLSCIPFLASSVSWADVSVFDNGLPVGRSDWLADGRLETLRYHRAGAARSHVAPAPPGDNLVLELPGAAADLATMVGRTERGLLLTCLWYIREVDPATLLLTGLTRDGVYLVEGGEVVGAVNNFRFNESPADLLARASEAGTTERSLGREFGEWYNRTAMPALRIPDFNMSSVSQAS